MAEISIVAVVALSLMMQTGVRRQALTNVRVQAVVTPPPIVMTPVVSEPVTRPLGLVPQEVIVGEDGKTLRCEKLETAIM